jgi:hypothetical protein
MNWSLQKIKNPRLPHLHKINKKKNYTVIPFFGEYSGIVVRLEL